MEKDRNRRYQTAYALLTDLRNIEEGLPLGTKIQPRRATFTQALIRKRLFIPAMVIVLAIIAVAIWQFLPQGETISVPKIENSLAVISFENLTGNNSNDIYQRTIPNLLITNLENTGYFYVATWERMRDILKQLDKNDAEFIDSDLGFELCRREGIGALVIGSLNKAGDMFVTDVKVYDVETKKSLKSVSSKGIGAQSIFETQIDELTREISLGMGLAKERVEAAKIQLRDVTTASPVAYDHYLKGRERYRKVDYTEAITQFKKAVEIDPSFAMGYLYLARSYWIQEVHEGAQVREERDEAFSKAKAYSNKATERERLIIEADYTRFIENNRERQIQLTEELVQKFPREKEAFITLARYYEGKDDEKALEMYNMALDLDPNYGEAHNFLGLFYFNRGESENALTHLKKQVEVSPGEPNPLDSLAHINFFIGKVDEALSNFEAALEIDPDFDQSMRCIPYIYAFKEDYGEAVDRIDKYMAAHKTLPVKWFGHLYKGFLYAWLGKYDEGFDNLTQAKQFAEKVENAHLALWTDFIKAQILRERGQPELSRKLNESWYLLYKEKFPEGRESIKSNYFWLNVLLDLQEGNLESAKSRLVEGKSLISGNPRIGKNWIAYKYNVLEAEILLAEGLSDEAIFLFRDETPIHPDIMWPNILAPWNFPFTRDQLARAYLQKGELDKAIQEYERLTASDRIEVHSRLIHPLYYYRVALLYEQKGWEGKAIESYEKFLDLWKNADQGLPELEDARKRLSKLKDQ